MRQGLSRSISLGLFFLLLTVPFLVWIWPHIFPPSPFPVVEQLVGWIKNQQYEMVYASLSDRWRREKSLTEYVKMNRSDEDAFFRLGGFIEETHVDQAGASFGHREVYVPVYCRFRVLGTNPPREKVSRWIFKLLLERGRWRLDGLKAFPN